MDEQEEKKDEPSPRNPEWLSELMKQHGHKNIWVLAPMVDQSDYPFRKLVRRYGCTLCFTPMIHARMLTETKKYKQKFLLRGDPTDRPLIAQMCGGNTETLLAAARLIEPYCDGIDLNCGCPQTIAKRGNYGAFLLESPDSLVQTVKQLVEQLNVPVSVKVRLVPTADSTCAEPKVDWEASIQLYRRLVRESGIHMLTVHGRTRMNKGASTGESDWDAVRKIVEELGSEIPIIANGSIDSLEQAQECLRDTRAAGVMSSEAILEYPALFHSGERIGRVQLAREYLDLARQYPSDQNGQGSGMKCTRAHIHRMLHADLEANTDIRQLLITGKNLDDFDDVVNRVDAVQKQQQHDPSKEKLSWYMRHRTENKSGLSDDRARDSMPKDLPTEGDETAKSFSFLFGESEL